ncbi:MAG: SpoIID/LytB domain-containing protein, partial [Oscillospiraceae bacterium]|nr:SpoIID/LytB domain-containing protein [Oscillospiraceae bacterium]
MKDYIIILIVFAVLLFATPFAVSVIAGEKPASPSASVVLDFPAEVELTLTETGEVINISVEDYIVGCLFAQIPVTYHSEAMNAQAVAAHTYLLRLIRDGAELSDDPYVCQPFFTSERAESHYGDSYKEHLVKIRAAARHGANRVIIHDGEPIHAVYHSISAGVTNTAYSVWGQDFPYLQSADSSWDSEHPNFHMVNEITSEDIRIALYEYNKTTSMPVDYEKWFINPIKNEYGYVISAKVGDSLLSGGDMWRMFGFRSPSFDISLRSGGIFIIETRGYGHGVGLSQFGADVL